MDFCLCAQPWVRLGWLAPHDALVPFLSQPVRRAFLILALPVLLLARRAGADATDAPPPGKTLPMPGEVFQVSGQAAFVIPAGKTSSAEPRPWVWYAPTLARYPGPEERWMFEQFLAAGISIAGIDVGESYGSPAGRALFTALYHELTRNRGYGPKPVLLGRSRGGLMTLAWAAENPERVGGFAGIYPVCNLASYPGVAKAAGAYGLTAAELESRLPAHNPIDRLAPLAAARVPFFAIHGDVDRIVPLEANSGLLHTRYTALGGRMELIVPTGQGHTMWTGFFQSDALVAFVKAHARP
jgi:pimeloyl-ACP methyl ester carboxylesterase